MVTTFTIDREKWLRGGLSPIASATPIPLLLDDQGRRCCLGFYAQACGLSDEQLANVSDPSEVGGVGQGAIPSEMNWLVRHDRFRDEVRPSDACNELTWTNDSPYTGPDQREREVARLFEERGITVEFTN